MAGTRRVRTLLSLWGAYWAGVAVMQLGPVLWEYVRIRRTMGSGTVSWGYSGSLTVLAVALAGPPLLIWLGWLALSGRERRARPGGETPNA